MKIAVLLTIFFLGLVGVHEETKCSEIQCSWDEHLKKFVSPNGKVDYAAWKSEQEDLDNYIADLQKNPPNESWSKNKKLAYWINAYNALTVQLILKHYPVQSIKNIKKPWDTKCFSIEGKDLTLGEIEHKILRKMDEPRIHFAINCASGSCPKLLNKSYSEEELEVQLKAVTKDFLRDEGKNKIAQGTWKLSKIFLWFSKDFGSRKELIEFINNYIEMPSAKPKVTFMEYDWSLNE